ncbi:2,3-bisphosphoglycerate-independent phosphoglycerate mutase [Helicobacter sp. T3_23-1056]
MKNNLTKPQKCVLIITDGIGHKPPSPYNAFANAKKPTYDWLFANVPYSLIHTYGDSVGLPKGQMGNSEVGHTSIGSGRILYQDLVRIQKSLQDGSLAQNPLLQNHAKNSKQVHLLGLMSDGGVHSHLEHLLAVAKIYAGFGKRVWLHLITDGRDVLPTSALGYLERVQNLCDEVEGIKIASMSGRYYAMDRDRRWERIEEAYKVIAFGESDSSLGNDNLSADNHCIDFADVESSQAREPSSPLKSTKNSTSTTSQTRIVGKNGGKDSSMAKSSLRADLKNPRGNPNPPSPNYQNMAEGTTNDKKNPPSLAEGVRGRVKSSDSSSLRVGDSEWAQFCEQNPQTTICHTEGVQATEVSQSQLKNRDISAFSKPQYDKKIIDKTIDCHAKSSDFARNDKIDSTSPSHQNVAEGATNDKIDSPSLAEGVRGRVKSTLESSPKSSLDSNVKSSLQANLQNPRLDSAPNLTPYRYIEQSYAQGITDEFIKPMAFNGFCGFEPKDGLMMINFRSDRAREIIQALSDESFCEFHRPKWFGQGLKTPQNAEQTLTMTQYDESFPYPILFPKITPQNTLAEVLSREGKTQAHIAETEKYAHVTFFFNGGVEEPFSGESRVLIPSPKVATYDLQPEMSAPEVGDAVCEAIKEGKDFVVVNFANGDMVGHTGKYEAAVRAVEAVDKELGKIYEVAKSCGYAVVLTSDHGNCEEMQNDKGEIKTNHTVGDVYCFVLAEGVKSVSEGGLNNIAPTVLKIMDLKIPKEMDKPLI